MDSNTHSSSASGGLGALAVELAQLAAQDTDQLTDTVRVEQVRALRRLGDRVEGPCLQPLAALAARGAAAADPDCPAPSTASWLRARLRLSPTEATSMVRT